VDQYFTVQPHTLLRQHLDYSHWYDRTKLTLKEIHNTQYVSCMNPTAGSFTINTRLQRHFSVFALSFPGTDALATIYNSILSQHMANNKFAVRTIFLLSLPQSGARIDRKPADRLYIPAPMSCLSAGYTLLPHRHTDASGNVFYSTGTLTLILP